MPFKRGGFRKSRGGGSRGGKGVRGGRKVRHPIKKTPKEPKENKVDEILHLDIERDATEFFTKNASFDQHFQAQNVNRDRYVATAMAFNDYSIEILPNARARSLAAAFARNDKPLIDLYLNQQKKFFNFGFVDVLKALNILDAKRERKCLEKKLERINANNTKQSAGRVMKTKKLGIFKNKIDSLTKMEASSSINKGVTGSLAKQIRKWVRTFSEKDLEFFALTLPTEPWKRLANLIHLNPSKDLSVDWFLPYCYGVEPPVHTKVFKCKSMTSANVNELISEFDDLPYSFVKKFKENLNDESKEKLAKRQEKLDTIIWYYEDLRCASVDAIIRARLEQGEKIELGYGKLMERLLKFRELNSTSLYSLIIPRAEVDLTKFKATIAAPVAVLGDASSSMSVAVRTSTIIASLLATICQAKLTFFHSANFEAKLKDPKNVSDVLEIAYTTLASGSTSPAASLVPYYNRKDIIKTFIIVTDEEENTNATCVNGKSWNFFDLFMEYRKTVYPAALIFVSFLHSQHDQGQMYKMFVRENVTDVLQFKFDRSRPDLTKLDSILGTICSKSSKTFAGHVEQLEADLKQNAMLMEALEKTSIKSPESTMNMSESVVVVDSLNKGVSEMSGSMIDESEYDIV